MAKEKELSDEQVWKGRAEHLDGLIRDTYKAIYNFLKEVATPVNDNIVNFNDRLKTLEAWVSERQKFESTTAETLRAIAQRVEKLEEIKRGPPSMLS